MTCRGSTFILVSNPFLGTSLIWTSKINSDLISELNTFEMVNATKMTILQFQFLLSKNAFSLQERAKLKIYLATFKSLFALNFANLSPFALGNMRHKPLFNAWIHKDHDFTASIIGDQPTEFIRTVLWKLYHEHPNWCREFNEWCTQLPCYWTVTKRTGLETNDGDQADWKVFALCRL